MYIWLTQPVPTKKTLFHLRPTDTDLATLIDKLQKNADKVEKNIVETEQNLNKVSTERLFLWITNQSQIVSHSSCLPTNKHVNAPSKMPD